MEIDLEKLPKKLVASAKNAKDYTFFIVKPNLIYQPPIIQANPNIIQASDLYLKLGPVPDENGQGEAEIKPSHADTIRSKLNGAEADAKAFVLATSLPTNQNPSKKLAVVQDVKIKGGASIKLKGIRTSVSGSQWVAYHHPILFAELSLTGPIRQVIADIEPKRQPIAMFACWTQATPGTELVGELVLGSAGDPHGSNANCRIPANFHRGGWWSGVPGWDRGVITVNVNPAKKYVFALYPRYAGQFTLTVKGTGQHAKLSDKITLTMNGNHPHPGD